MRLIGSVILKRKRIKQALSKLSEFWPNFDLVMLKHFLPSILQIFQMLSQEKNLEEGIIQELQMRGVGTILRWEGQD